MARAKLFIRFEVPGVAEPRGSKTIGKTRDGRTFIRDDNPESKKWMSIVHKAAELAMWTSGKSATELPVLLSVMVYRERPAGHFGTGRNEKNVRGSAPYYPAVKPDLTKLVRGIEDAMNGVVWVDDGQVVSQKNDKRYGPMSKVLIEVFTLPATVREVEQQKQGQGVLL